MGTAAEWRAGNPAELGKTIARLRQRAGLRQEDLADRAGIRREYLSKIESGHATEQLRSLFMILRALGNEFAVVERIH
ncbi:MAG: helix-turn-helix transcriptional regulator [Actinomycetota bacterium]|nr:helix-turn-helix transcriptional regulator [Actinomycetota bacterium]